MSSQYGYFVTASLRWVWYLILTSFLTEQPFWILHFETYRPERKWCAISSCMLHCSSSYLSFQSHSNCQQVLTLACWSPSRFWLYGLDRRLVGRQVRVLRLLSLWELQKTHLSSKESLKRVRGMARAGSQNGIAKPESPWRIGLWAAEGQGVWSLLLGRMSCVLRFWSFLKHFWSISEPFDSRQSGHPMTILYFLLVNRSC